MSIPLHKYFSRAEYLKGREVYYPLTEEMEQNLIKLLTALNPIREAYGKGLIVSSGYRDPGTNERVGGSKKSNHMMCLACDFKDNDEAFGKWCMENLALLEEHGLYMESLTVTHAGKNKWVHLQKAPTKSGNRVFMP